MTAFHTPVPLRWSDLDVQGHVNNVAALDFTQEARARFMAESPAPALLVDGSVLVSQRIEFLRPLVLSDEPVDVGLGATKVGAARFSMAYQLRQNGELCARVATVMCPFDFENQRVRRLTDMERECLKAISVPEEPWRKMSDTQLDGRGEPIMLAPRWSDQDRFGHVNNVRILDWVQEARIESTSSIDPAMARRGQLSSNDPDADLWLVARQDVDYIHQLAWRPEPYCVVTAPLRVGATSVTLGCEIIDPLEGSTRVRCTTVLVHGGASGRPSPLPESTREAMTARLVV
ncbi:acyl-CoA thioesterase [Propionibacterium sp.]|uniref:acyl-CoA thioesterase n=1 Tax=Propionibacterium sp. TaxID=1977903 RepID=UPI0039E92F85